MFNFIMKIGCIFHGVCSYFKCKLSLYVPESLKYIVLF